MGSRVKPGDVFAVQTRAGLGLLQFLGKHPEFGDVVLVASRLHDRPLIMTEELFRRGYATFYPVRLAARTGLVEKAGHVSPARMPRRFRRPGVVEGARIKNWILDTDSGPLVVDAPLSLQDAVIPILSIWNHEYLVDRLLSGWRPEFDAVPTPQLPAYASAERSEGQTVTRCALTSTALCAC